MSLCCVSALPESISAFLQPSPCGGTRPPHVFWSLCSQPGNLEFRVNRIGDRVCIQAGKRVMHAGAFRQIRLPNGAHTSPQYLLAGMKHSSFQKAIDC